MSTLIGIAVLAITHPAHICGRGDAVEVLVTASSGSLNFSCAWCFRALAGALAADDPRRAVMEGAAGAHLAASLPHVAGDYMGEHWLASFALLALEVG